MLLIIDMTINKKSKYLNMLMSYLDKIKIKYFVVSNLEDFLKLNYLKIKGLIISGSSLSLLQLNNEKLEILRKAIYPLILTDVPVLGICFGYQLLNYVFNGKINKLKYMEKCTKEISINNANKLLKNPKNKLRVWLHHKDYITELSRMFEAIAYDNKYIMAFYNKQMQYYGVQFHPEAKSETLYIIKNFIKICKIKF